MKGLFLKAIKTLSARYTSCPVMQTHLLFYVLTLSAKRHKQTFLGMELFCMPTVVVVSRSFHTSIKIH